MVSGFDVLVVCWGVDCGFVDDSYFYYGFCCGCDCIDCFGCEENGLNYCKVDYCYVCICFFLCYCIVCDFGEGYFEIGYSCCVCFGIV